MNVKLKAMVKVAGDWKGPGETVDLPDKEARRLIDIGAAEASGPAPATPAAPDPAELEALKAELARLQTFEQQQLAAAAEAEAKAQAEKEKEKEELERKAAEEAEAKGKGRAAAKGDANGQADGK